MEPKNQNHKRSSNILGRGISDKRDKFGAFRSPEDPNDCVYELLAEGVSGYYTAEMPEEFDLRKYSKPSRDQGSRGTCAAFTAASIREIHSARKNDISPDLSAEFIYYHRDSKPLKGMHGRDVFQILQRIGTVPESEYPYGTDESVLPDPTLYKLASKHRLDNFAKIESCEGLKRALLEIGPCYLLLPLYANRPYFWRAENEKSPRGGHAVAVVGYNKEGFILKNSWGPTWNDDGCIIFPYTEWGIQWECWVGIDSDNQLSRRVSPKINLHRITNAQVMADEKTPDKPVPRKKCKFLCCIWG